MPACSQDCGNGARARLRFRQGPRAEMKYSVFSLLREAFRGHTGWKPAWRKAEPKAEYDVVIVGGGGHGLATAYYLAKEHGITNVAVLEKGYIGSGNVGPQHHHHPLQLPAARQRAVLRMVDEAVGGAGAGPQLQRDGEPARRAEPLSFATRSATPSRAAATRCGCTASMPSCSTASGVRAHGAVPRFRQCALPDPRRPAAAARRHGAARRRGVGLCARRRHARRRHHRELRGDRLRRRGRPRSTGVETTRGTIRREEGRPRGRRQHLARRRAGGPAAADREPCAAGLRVGRHQAGDRHASSRSAPGTSTSASPTRAGSSSAATSTATTPMRSAATCRSSRT